MDFICATSAKYGLRIPNVFHAGDGNIHPLVLYDERDPDQVKRAIHAGEDILDKCVELGGSVSVEHGIGVEKIDFMARQFSSADLAEMQKLRLVFDPALRCNPHKMFPIETPGIPAPQLSAKATAPRGPPAQSSV